MISNKKYIKVLSSPAKKVKTEVNVNNQDITITQNGYYQAEPPYTGFGLVRVAVPTGGGVINPLYISPSTQAQVIDAPTGVDGFAPVSVSAVTSSIDSNIQANNIKSGVSILGVTGNYIGGVPCFVELALDANNKLIKHSGVFITGAVDIGDYTLERICYAVSNSYEVSGSALLNSGTLKTISGTYAMVNAFSYQQNITETGMDAVETISGASACNVAFQYCRGITRSGLGNLKTISGRNACYDMFLGCSNLEDIEMDNLETISSYQYSMFRNCTKLTIADFPKLNSIAVGMAMYKFFDGCTSLANIYFRALTSNSFGSYTSQFNSMLNGVIGCTVHFPSNLQSVIGSWEDVIGGFGGTNTTVLFDLTATS